MNNEYVTGLYSELNLPSEVMINGNVSTLDELNKIFTTDFNVLKEEDTKERIRLVNEDGIWILKFQSGNETILDNDFDYNLIMW